MTNDTPDTTGAANGDAAVAAPDLSATIWPEVDRALSGITATAEKAVLDVIVFIPRDEIIDGLRRLKNDETLAFDYLRSLTAVDQEEAGMEVVYHLYSTTRRHNLTVKVALDNDDLTIDTATVVWKAANWLERETAEMFGIRFNDHPDPRTLLMPEDMADTFPLRKSHPLQEIEILQGEGMGYGEEGPA
ncbi:MAG: NADH-quinone oxidoreductase subunit C [Dehalococcoidia bacterium]